MDSSAAEVVVSGLLGGGLIGSGVALYRAKKLANPERDSYIATASKDVVTSLHIALSDRDATIKRKNAELAHKDQRIAALESERDADAERIKALSKELAELQAQYSTIAGLLSIAQQTTGRLQREIAELQANRNTTT